MMSQEISRGMGREGAGQKAGRGRGLFDDVVYTRTCFPSRIEM